MTDRPVEGGSATEAATSPGDGPRAVMSARDVAILRSLADRIDPEDPGAHNNLGVVFFQKGLVDDALAAFERALELDPRLAVARINLQIAYARSGQLRRKVKNLLSRLAEDRQDREARDALARTYLLGGNPEGAAREWRMLLTDRPDSVPLHMKLAHAESERGRNAEAERLLVRALEIEPGDAAVHVQLAELHQKMGHAAKALGSARRAAELAPGEARTHALLATLLDAVGRPEEAESARERAATLNPAVLEDENHLSLERYFSMSAVRAEREPASVEGPLLHFARATELRRRGDLEGAGRELEEALSAGEDAQEVRQALAELKLIRGEVEEAAADYLALIEARPDSPKLWNERGVALHRGGSGAEAVEAYRRAVATDHAYALAWSNLGVALAQRGDEEAAERAFRKGAENEAPVEVLWNLSLFLSDLGRTADAVETSRVALERDRDAPEAWARLGSALFQAGEAAEARDALVRALDLNPDHAEARYQLGFVLSALGDFPGALRETKRALELDPLFPAPRYRLLIDVEYESGALFAPAMDAAHVRPGVAVPGFEPDREALDRAFSGMAMPQVRRPADYVAAMKRARVALDRGQARRAAELAGQAHAAVPGAPEPLLLQARAQLSIGLAGEALERFDAVLASGAAELARDARIGRARCLLQLDRPDDAAAALESVGGAEALAVRARALLAAGDVNGSIRAYEAVLQAGTAGARVLTGMGEALLAARRPADAEPAFRRALRLEPGTVAARVGLGDALAALGDREGAETEYDAAVKLLPSFGDAVVKLALLRWQAGRRPAALRGLIDFLQLDPTHVEALVRLGMWLYELGRPAHAATALRRAVRLDPENALARSELHRVVGEGSLDGD